jgi:WD40 repeat protein
MNSEPSSQPLQGQQSVASRHSFWWSARRVYVVFVSLFGLAVAASWWLTPIVPYATLDIEALGNVKTKFSPDGSLLATSFYGGRGNVRVWDVAAGRECLSIPIRGNTYEELQFSQDNRLLAVHEEEDNLKLWEINSGKTIAAIGPFKGCVCFRFSPDGQFLIYQDNSGEWPDKDIVFWNIATQQEDGRIESYFFTLVFSEDGRECATYRQKKNGTKYVEVLHWKVDPAPKLIREHRVMASADADLPGDYCGSIVAISPDLKSFASADDLPNGRGEVVLWDMATGEKRWSATFSEHGTKLKRLSFVADGKILAAFGEGEKEIRWQWRTTLWDMASEPKEIGSFVPRTAVSPNAEWLAIPLNSGAELVNVVERNRGAELIVNGDKVKPGHHDEDLDVPMFSPDSKLLAVSLRWSELGKPLDKWLPPKFNPFPERQPRASVRVWSVESGREMLHCQACADAWFSPDGKVLATVGELDRSGRESSQHVELWHLPLGRSPWRILFAAVVIWLVAVLASWLAVKAFKRLSSTRMAAANLQNAHEAKG